MPKLLAYVIESRGKARPIVLQENATPASLANLRSFKVAKVPMVPVGAAGIVFAWHNPESSPILVTRVIIDVTTPSTGAAFIDVGVVNNAAATAATIIDGTANDLAGVITIDHLLVGGDGEGGVHLVAAHGAGVGAWITGRGTADTTPMVGNAYIVYQEV